MILILQVLIPSQKNNNGPKVVEISATSLTGHFIGDLERLGCTEADTAFLYAGSKGKPVRCVSKLLTMGVNHRISLEFAIFHRLINHFKPFLKHSNFLIPLLQCYEKHSPCRISLEFDGSNKSLKAAKLLSTMPEDMTKSISADIIKNRPKRVSSIVMRDEHTRIDSSCGEMAREVGSKYDNHFRKAPSPRRSSPSRRVMRAAMMSM